MLSRLWSSLQTQLRRTCAPLGLATVQDLWYRRPAQLRAQPGGGAAWLHGLRDVPYSEAAEALCALPGVGPKVPQRSAGAFA